MLGSEERERPLPGDLQAGRRCDLGETSGGEWMVSAIDELPQVRDAACEVTGAEDIVLPVQDRARISRRGPCQEQCVAEIQGERGEEMC